MSSTERAPEPTMEEILASIRRIISDDEANAERQEPAPEGYVRPAAADDSEEGIADTQIIADIERVLAGQGAQPEQTEDEILDLTDLGGMTEAPADAEMVEELVVADLVEEIAVETAPAPSFASAFPPAAEPEAPAEPVAAMEPPSFESAPQYMPEPAQPMPEPVYAAPPAPEPVYTPPPAPEPVIAPAPPAEDPTVALERAIAALKAGDLAAFARVADAKSAPPAEAAMPAATPPMPAAHEPLPAAGPTLAEQFAGTEEPQAIMEVGEEEEFVILSEPEPAPEPQPAEEAAWLAPEEAAAAPGVSTPWHSDDTTWAPKTAPSPEFAASAPRTNGGSSHKTHDYNAASPKTLEDSVKEMLRPMLRKWLDENMQRVLTQALREELEDPEVRRRQG